jgi:hypothetical protein
VAHLSTFNLTDFHALCQRLHIAPSATLEGAAQQLTDFFYQELVESVVLVRVYVTLRYWQLTTEQKLFAQRLAQAKGISDAIRPETFALTLLGTRGDRDEWNDRRRSQGHAVIPLTGASFVESIPMISRLMKDMGIGIDWLDKGDTQIVTKVLGILAGVFYVEDAKSALDCRDRLVIPDQGFVVDNQVRTVFGIGGGYPNGSFATLIVFTRETLSKAQVELFLSMINIFKTGTMSAAMRGRIFDGP